MKGVSVILIFLFVFLGFTTYQDITKIVESDFEEKFSVQDEKIKALDSVETNYGKLVESLKSEEGRSIENLNDVKREFGKINQKVSQTQDTLRDTSQIYVVQGLKHYNKKLNESTVSFHFKNLITTNGEKLPKLSKPPIINVQGKGPNYYIDEATTEYVKLHAMFLYEGPDFEILDLWIVTIN